MTVFISLGMSKFCKSVLSMTLYGSKVGVTCCRSLREAQLRVISIVDFKVSQKKHKKKFVVKIHSSLENDSKCWNKLFHHTQCIRTLEGIVRTASSQLTIVNT